MIKKNYIKTLIHINVIKIFFIPSHQNLSCIITSIYLKLNVMGYINFTSNKTTQQLLKKISCYYSTYLVQQNKNILNTTKLSLNNIKKEQK
jgi:hypothetical protein